MAVPVLEQIPGPTSFLGLESLNKLRQTGMLAFLLENWHAYGDIFRFQIGPATLIAAVHPDMVRQITISHKDHYTKGISYDVVRRYIVGNGLVTAVGEDWLWQRRMMAEFFTPRAVTRFAEMMRHTSQQMLDRWQAAAASGTYIEMSEQMIDITAEMIVQAIFSVHDPEGIALVKGDVETMLRFAADRQASLIPLPLGWPSARNRAYTAARARVLDFIHRLIARRQAVPQSDWPDDLLSKILSVHDTETGRAMSTQQIIDNALTFFVAGHETTARTMTFALYLLAQNPDIEARLIAELDQTLSSEQPTLDELQRLGYTLRVVKEALRLYPPAAFYPRDVAQPDTLGGFAVRPGDRLFLVPYLTHRHPDFWPDPERFEPDRHTPEQENARHPQAYAPFSAGQRICIGNHFSLLEATILLAMIYRRYRPRLKPGHDPRIMATATLVATNGLPMTLEPR
jgi:cytochrome P450